MIKQFYKIKKKPKTFFDPKIQTRTNACGEAVLREVREWQTYFFSEWRGGNGGLTVTKGGNITGDEISDKAKPEQKPRSVGGLGMLSLSRVQYEIRHDGFVYANGTASELNVGVDTKAWGLITVPSENSVHNAFAVIGKPVGSERMLLAIYEISKLRPTKKMLCSVELEHTMNISSDIVCFGKHIFALHNSKLSYHYYNTEKNELEEVAIGTDGENSQKPWCQGVSAKPIIDRGGSVFWICERDIYAFSIGYARNLSKIELSQREIPLGIRAVGDLVYLYTEDKNSHNRITSYCQRCADGEYQRVMK